MNVGEYKDKFVVQCFNGNEGTFNTFVIDKKQYKKIINILTYRHKVKRG